MVFLCDGPAHPILPLSLLTQAVDRLQVWAVPLVCCKHFSFLLADLSVRSVLVTLTPGSYLFKHSIRSSPFHQSCPIGYIGAFLLYDLVLSETILFGYVFAPVPVMRAVECVAKVGLGQVT